MFVPSLRSSLIAATMAMGAGPLAAQPAAFSRSQAFRASGSSRGIITQFAAASRRQSAASTRGSAPLIAGQILAGTLGAIAGGILAFKVFDDPEGPNRKVKGDAGYTPNANTAYALGSFIGGTAVVHLVGRSDGSRAPLWSTAMGTGLATIPLLFGREEPYLPLLGIVFIAPLQGVLGTVAYQGGRQGAH